MGSAYCCDTCLASSGTEHNPVTRDALERASAPPPRAPAVPPPQRQAPSARSPPAAAVVRPTVGDLASRPRVSTTLNGADRRNARSVRFAAHLPELDHASTNANANDAPTPAVLTDNEHTPALGDFNADAGANADADANDAATPAAPGGSGPDAVGDFTSASMFVVCLHGAVLARSGGIWRDFGDRRAGAETPRETAFRGLHSEIGLTEAQVEVAPDQPVWVVRAGLRHAVFVATLPETIRRDLDFHDSLSSSLRGDFVDFGNFFRLICLEARCCTNDSHHALSSTTLATHTSACAASPTVQR